MKKLSKYIFFVILLFHFSTNIYAETNWITKKKSSNKKEIEKVEEMYADGFLTKSECVKAKSKLLKIPKISKTICDNVKVKVAKKEEKTDLFLESHIYILPSYAEGLPATLIEAMSFQLPVITTPVGSIPEIINKVDLFGFFICISLQNSVF